MFRVLIVATFVLASLAHAAAQQTVFRAETDLVSFGVTVIDRRGNFVTDLTRDDFEILEDGKPQTLKYFVVGNQADAAPELHIGLLFDTSGSMSADIATARTAAIKFLRALPEAEGITLVDFDTEVRLAKFGQQDFPRIVERIRNRKPDGFTALYDALGQYVLGAGADQGRKVLDSVHRWRRHAQRAQFHGRDDAAAWFRRDGLCGRVHAEPVVIDAESAAGSAWGRSPGRVGERRSFRSP